MSQADLDRAIECMATDAAFAAAVRSNPGAALPGFDLDETERLQLAGMQSTAPAAMPAAPVLATRRSKSSMLGIGAVAAVAAVGAAGYGGFRYLTRATFDSYEMSIQGGARHTVNSVTNNSSSTYTVVKPIDDLSPVLRQDLTNGVRIQTITLFEENNGQDATTITLTDVIVSSDSVSAISSGQAATETVKFTAAQAATAQP